MIVSTNNAHAWPTDKLAQRVANDLGVQVIQAGGRFIEQQHGRILDQSARDCGTLLLAA
jgi:hypothetical protein